MRHKARVIEDNSGGLALYVDVRDANGDWQVVYAHAGYEARPHTGGIMEDLTALLRDDSVESWDGHQEDVAEYYRLRLQYIRSLGNVVAWIDLNGRLTIESENMGLAAKREFGLIGGQHDSHAGD